MIVIVSNKQKDALDNANIDAIKEMNGQFTVDDLINNFKNYFFTKMIIDATSIVEFTKKEVLTKLVGEFGVDKIVLLLPEKPEPPKKFVDMLTKIGIKNYCTNINDLKGLINEEVVPANTFEGDANMLQANEEKEEEESNQNNDSMNNNFNNMNSISDFNNMNNNINETNNQNNDMNNNFNNMNNFNNINNNINDFNNFQGMNNNFQGINNNANNMNNGMNNINEFANMVGNNQMSKSNNMNNFNNMNNNFQGMNNNANNMNNSMNNINEFANMNNNMSNFNNMNNNFQGMNNNTNNMNNNPNSDYFSYVSSNDNSNNNDNSMDIYNEQNNNNVENNTNQSFMFFQDVNNTPNNDVNSKILGVKAVTEEAGTTSLIYMLKKTYEKHGNRVGAYEYLTNDFRYFRSKDMFSINDENDFKNRVKSDDYNIKIIDLNNNNFDDICDDIIYLVEPSIIKMNKLTSTNPTLFSTLVGKKVVLNKCLLSGNEIGIFEKEANMKFFATIPPLNDRSSSSSLDELINKLNLK